LAERVIHVQVSQEIQLAVVVSLVELFIVVAQLSCNQITIVMQNSDVSFDSASVSAPRFNQV
jgi:hypothetical protein